MFTTSLLLANLPVLESHSIITTAVTQTTQRLVIVLFYNNNALNWSSRLRLLTHVYVKASAVAHSLDNILFNIDVLLLHSGEDIPSIPVDVVFRVAGDSIPVSLPSDIPQHFLAPSGPIRPQSPPLPPPSPPSLFPVVALGGTFDHLHPGHKILLTMAASITSQKLIVGVTDDSLLQKKTHLALLEPLPTRIAAVRAFLTLVCPSIIHDVVPIHDVYGPTAWDPNVNAIVVSHETLSGADAVASHRKAHGLPPLQTFVIDVISPSSPCLDAEDMDSLRRTKMSSTFIRQWIFEKEQAKSKHPSTDAESHTNV